MPTTTSSALPPWKTTTTWPPLTGTTTWPEACSTCAAAETRTPIGDDQPDSTTNRDPAKTLRVEVTDGGRAVVNLRIPLSLGRAALSQVPGISDATSDRIREAITAGIKGPIVDVDDGDDGVRISLE